MGSGASETPSLFFFVPLSSLGFLSFFIVFNRCNKFNFFARSAVNPLSSILSGVAPSSGPPSRARASAGCDVDSGVGAARSVYIGNNPVESCGDTVHMRAGRGAAGAREALPPPMMVLLLLDADMGRWSVECRWNRSTQGRLRL